MAAAALAGCGFRLRQPPHLRFGSIALVGFAPRSPLGEELRRQLGDQVRVVETPDKAELVLQSLDDLRERTSVATTSAAQVRDMTLRVKFSFRVYTPAGRDLIPRGELLLSRDLTYSENFALAKEAEEAELFTEMQSDIVAQVLRRLASLQV
jgi:LPS-assembly lipoprotein